MSWKSSSPRPNDGSQIYSKTQTRSISAIWVISCEYWERGVCVFFFSFWNYGNSEVNEWDAKFYNQVIRKMTWEWSQVRGKKKKRTKKVKKCVLQHCLNFWVQLSLKQTGGFAGSASSKESTCRCRRYRRLGWSLGQEDPLAEETVTHSSILPEKFCGEWNLVGYSPWGHKELDTTEHKDNGNPRLQLFFFSFIFISWRLITSQHFSGFCHTLTWISHGVTCIPHPNSPSHLPLHPIPLGLLSAPGPSTCLMHPTWAGDLLHYR